MISPAEPQEPGEPQGGMGGSIVPGSIKNPGKPATRDIRMIERLMKRRDWNISDVAFERLPNEILLIALDKQADGRPANYSTRERLSAAKVLAHMNRQNQDNHPMVQEHDHRHLHVTADAGKLIADLTAEAERWRVIEGTKAEPGNGNGKPQIG